jgi:hypothetical protein
MVINILQTSFMVFIIMLTIMRVVPAKEVSDNVAGFVVVLLTTSAVVAFASALVLIWAN